MFFQVLQVSGVYSLEYTFRNGHMTQRQKPMSIEKKIINSKFHLYQLDICVTSVHSFYTIFF